MAYYVKDPDAAVDYLFDWSTDYLGSRTLVSSSWRISPADAGLVVAAEVARDRQTIVTLSGGRVGHVYRITNHIVLSDGRRDERSLTLRVEDR